MLDDAKREKLKELELNRGGVAFVTDKTLAKPNPTIIFSLGGLGGMTLNTLKGKFIKEIGEAKHIFFRVVDTCAKDVDQICKTDSNGRANPNPSANIDRGEVITLYSAENTHLLSSVKIPANIKAWLNPSLIGTVLDDKGAKQKRQIGRSMLLSSTVYSNVYSQVNRVIDRANRHRVGDQAIDVIIIAGVSGGTGSGSIIDFTYLIHDVFRSLHIDAYNIAGYIYTPEAQFKETGIYGNDDIQLNLMRNGYAALKEIDYFMNLSDTHGTYKLDLGTSTKTSDKDIFSTCSIISGFSVDGGINDLQDTIGRLTEDLMDILTNITFQQGEQTMQMSSSFLSNADAINEAWFTNHPSRKEFHRYASYKYQILGYSSLVVPRDEILAYCVNKIYQNVLEDFKNYRYLTKEIMDPIYKNTFIDDGGNFREYALRINPNDIINRNIRLDDNYTKRQLKDDPMIGYEDACSIAEAEAEKVIASPLFGRLLSEQLYNGLMKEIDDLFQKFGPFVTLKAMEHKSIEEGIGDPDQPFSGICETLRDLRDFFLNEHSKCVNRGKNVADAIEDKAREARSGIFTNQTAMDAYKRTCCQFARSIKLDAVLYQKIADILGEVETRIAQYNNDVFDVYTEIMSEITKILNKDSQYFAESYRIGNSYSLDIIKDGGGDIAKLQKYLDDFIAHTSVKQLADNFIKSMRNNKNKWLALNNANEFDVVSEVRRLIDECFVENNMTTEIIEKFLTVAFSNQDLTVKELDRIWNDSDSTEKMRALQEAANNIYHELAEGAKVMANSKSIPFNPTFSSKTYIGSIQDAPLLSNILAEIVQGNTNTTLATSTAKNKFIMTTVYYSIPIYNLSNMDVYNNAYVMNPVDGLHMDENNVDWRRFPNPYTIDSVGRDIQANKQPKEFIKDYPDYQLLVDLQKNVDKAIDEVGSIKVEKLPTSVTFSIYDIVREPDAKEFREALKEAIRRKKVTKETLLPFMMDNGYVVNSVLVSKGNTDIELDRRNFDDIESNTSLMEKYSDIFVPIPDVYKWIRKNIDHVMMIERNLSKFESILQVYDEVAKEIKIKEQYSKDIESFAFGLRSGQIAMKDDNKLVWQFVDNKKPITVNLKSFKKIDQEQFLYHIFSVFYNCSTEGKDMIKAAGKLAIENDNEVDISEIKAYVEEMLSDECLGYIFNKEAFNNNIIDQGVADRYLISDISDIEDTFEVLTRFYKLLEGSL